MLVFWPLHETSTGFVLGWKHPEIYVVAGVFPSKSYADILSVLLRSNDNARSIFPEDVSYMSLAILGEVVFPKEQNKIPHISWHATNKVTVNKFIYYQRWKAKSMRFFSLNNLHFHAAGPNPCETSIIQLKPSHAWSLRLQRNCYISGVDMRHQMQIGVHPGVIRQINFADAVASLFEHYMKSSRDVGSIEPGRYCGPYLGKFDEFISTIRVDTSSLYYLKKLFPRNISALAQQAKVRFGQISFVCGHLCSPFSQRIDVSHNSIRYISFYNCFWLMLNDVVIGFTFSIFIRENHVFLGNMLKHWGKFITVDLVQESLSWLDDWPAGLKLNTELSGFYRLVFSGLFGLWEVILDECGPYISYAIYSIAFIGQFGLSLMLATLLDTLSLLTCPLYVSYLLVAITYRRLLFLAISLFNLFRGRRHNVLRNRTDSWNFDIDQLLLGTIFFTLVAFLFPTVMVYYCLFAMSRFAVIFLNGFLETALTFMNHFPLFAMMLGIKDPSRLPAGVVFEFSWVNDLDMPHLLLKSSPVTYSKMFDQFLFVWFKLTAYYNPARLLKSFLSGSYLIPVSGYSIQQNSLVGKI